MTVSNQGLRDYLKLTNIYKGDAIKKKTGIIEMIIYGCTTNKLNKKEIEDLSTNRARKMLKANGINLKSLPGYGNARSKKKDMKAVEYGGESNSNNMTSIKVIDY